MDTLSLSDVIYGIIEDQEGAWISRSDLAALLGRPKGTLYPHDLTTLDALVQQGRIESQQRTRGVLLKFWVYRVRA